MKKKEATEIINLKFKLTCTLIDDLFIEIGELRAKGLNYQEISQKVWIPNGRLSKFINWDPSFYDGITNKTLAIWLDKFKTNK